MWGGITVRRHFVLQHPPHPPGGVWNKRQKAALNAYPREAFWIAGGWRPHEGIHRLVLRQSPCCPASSPIATDNVSRGAIALHNWNIRVADFYNERARFLNVIQPPVPSMDRSSTLSAWCSILHAYLPKPSRFRVHSGKAHLPRVPMLIGTNPRPVLAAGRAAKIHLAAPTAETSRPPGPNLAGERFHTGESALTLKSCRSPSNQGGPRVMNFSDGRRIVARLAHRRSARHVRREVTGKRCIARRQHTTRLPSRNHRASRSAASPAAFENVSRA